MGGEQVGRKKNETRVIFNLIYTKKKDILTRLALVPPSPRTVSVPGGQAASAST